jgi:hypothetical protein
MAGLIIKMNINIIIHMKKIYRIVKHTYYDKGTEKKHHYTIQYQSKFLWRKLWDNIMDTECDKEECQSYPLTFSTELDATTMINNLQNGYKLKGWNKEVTKVVEFPKVTD